MTIRRQIASAIQIVPEIAERVDLPRFGDD